MKENKVRRGMRIINKAPELVARKYKDDSIFLYTFIGLEETQDSSSAKKSFFCLEKKLSCLPSNKENVYDGYRERKKDVYVTPLALSRISNLMSTAASSIDSDLLRKSEKDLIKEDVPTKGSKKGKVARVNSNTSYRIMKKNEDGKKLYKSHLVLVDRITKKSENFRLYKDKEIGFEKDLQETIKETVTLL
jgi:hypothetical protein